MDILERINELRTLRGWSIYKLAEEAGMTQSTLSNMFSRKTLPSISTLNQLCDAFQISLSEFFNENSELDEETQYIVSMYKKLDKRDKQIVKKIIESF